MVADNLEKVQMRGERIDELDERAGESNDCVSNMLWVGLIKSCAQLSSSPYPSLVPKPHFSRPPEKNCLGTRLPIPLTTFTVQYG